MNLFDYVKLYGTSKGFVGKSFFVPTKEVEIFKCLMCEEKVQGVNRLTCSVACALEYKKITKSYNHRFYMNKIYYNIKNLGKQEFLDLMVKKYGVKN